MYFEKSSEFITAMLYAEFSTYSDETKKMLLTKIYEEYLHFNDKNIELEDLYKELTTKNFLPKTDSHFLHYHNGKIFSLKQLINHNIKVHHLITSPYVTTILPIITTNKKYKCLICDNDNKDKFFKYKNSFNYDTVYCKNCLQFGISNNINFYFTINIPHKEITNLALPPTKLSIPQKEISDKLVTNIKNKKNTLVWAVCGAGKTEIIYKTIFENIILGHKMCIAIPRKDVVKELAIRIQTAFNIEINILHGDNKTLNSSNLYIMTTHQLKNYYNFFDLIILDEVDAFPYNGDKILEYFLKKSLKKDAPILFLSATPSKKIQKFSDIVHTLPIRYHQHLLDIPKIVINKKLIFQLERLIICDTLKNFLDNSLASHRRILLFVPTIKLIKPVQKMLAANKYSTISVSSIDKARDKKIKQFKNWEHNIMITTTILERGVTFDYLDVCVFYSNHGHFTKEALIQIAGRVGRKHYDPAGEILFLASEKTKIMNTAKAEIIYMNDLAKLRKLWRKDNEMPIL